MSTNFNDIVKQGTVRIKNKLGMYQESWLILRRPSSRGPLRLEKFKNEKASMLMESGGKCIELKDIYEIDNIRKDNKSTVNVMFENGKCFQMAVHLESEATAWAMFLHDFCRSSEQREGPPGMDLLLNSNMQDVFNVFLVETPLLSVYGECLLQVTSDSIYLLDVDDPKRRLTVWPLPSLRRYSRDASKFIFESGRSCKTGEGIFIFNTIHSEDIYQKVSGASIALAQLYPSPEPNGLNLSNDVSPTRNGEQRPLPPTPGASNSSRGVPSPPVRRN